MNNYYNNTTTNSNFKNELGIHQVILTSHIGMMDNQCGRDNNDVWIMGLFTTPQPVNMLEKIVEKQDTPQKHLIGM